MLMMDLKKGEKIKIGENIFLKFEKIQADTIRIGIDAPKEIKIVREKVKPPTLYDTLTSSSD